MGIENNQCDLCKKNTQNLARYARDDIENLEWMCDDCASRLNETLTEARKFVHKYITDELLKEADAIRSESE